MGNKKKNAVKRTGKNGARETLANIVGKTANGQEALRKIVTAVKAFNDLYCRNDPDSKLYLQTEQERQIEGAKMMSYGEQYANDVACITLNEVYGFYEERQRRFAENYLKNYQKYAKEAAGDLKDDKKGEYSDACFESNLKEAVGKYYLPHAERYKVGVYWNGERIEF